MKNKKKMLYPLTPGGGGGNLQPNKDVAPTTSEQEVVADEGYDGLEKVTIEAVTSTIDNNIQAGNIKEGVSILGVTGNYPSGQLTVNANGTVDVKDYKTALVNVTAEGVDEAVAKIVNGTATTFVNPTGNTKIMPYKFYNHTALTGIDLTGITNLGERSFYQCTGLTSVEIPSSVTSQGTYVFYQCTGLTSATVNKAIGEHTFDGCSNLANVTLGSSITSLPNYHFNNCTKIANINLDNVGTYGSYSCYSMGSLVNNPTTEINRTASTTINPYAFQYAHIKSFKNSGSTTLYDYSFANTVMDSFESRITGTNGTYAFNDSQVKRIDLKNTSISLQAYIFQNTTKVESIELSNATLPNFNSTGYQFYNMGNARANLSTELVMDFRKSTFNTIYQYSLGGLNNTKIMMPTTLTTINANAFNGCKKLKLVLQSEPTLSNVSGFASNEDLKIFVPYTSIETMKAKSNWTTYSDNIYGYITGDDVIANYGGVFPTTTTTSGIDLAWFSDTEFTNLVTTPVAGEIYYCMLGPVYYTLSYAANSTVVVSDGTNTYASGDRVILGTNLTITFTGDSGYTPYLITVNDVTVADETSTETTVSYTTTMLGDLNVLSMFWNGTDIPVQPIMGNNSWDLIKIAVANGLHRTFNWVGQTKTVNINGTDYLVRMIDDTANRYTNTTSGLGTNAVFEFVNCYNEKGTYNASGYTGNFSASRLYNWLNNDFYNMLPSDLQGALENTTYPSADNNNNLSQISSKILLGSEYEYFGSRTYAPASESTSQYTLYANWSNYTNPNTGTTYTSAANARIKGLNSAPTSGISYWTRSRGSGNISNSVRVYSDGSVYSGYVYFSLGFAPCFAF